MIEKGTQLKGYIQRETKAVPMHSNYGYTYYFCRTFLQRLYKENPDYFILRGSYAQYANLKTINRPLTDIDLVTFKHIESAKNTIEQTIKINDQIKFEIKQKFVTTNSTINYRIGCTFDNIQHLISLDLKSDNSFDSQINELPKLFSQDEIFNVNAATLEEGLASKIYVVLLNLYLQQKLGKEFRRFKDFYDIQCILQSKKFDENKVREILAKKITTDNFLNSYNLTGNVFDKQFVTQNMDQWNQEKKKYEFKNSIEFDDSVDSLNKFIFRKK